MKSKNKIKIMLASTFSLVSILPLTHSLILNNSNSNKILSHKKMNYNQSNLIEEDIKSQKYSLQKNDFKYTLNVSYKHGRIKKHFTSFTGWVTVNDGTDCTISSLSKTNESFNIELSDEIIKNYMSSNGINNYNSDLYTKTYSVITSNHKNDSCGAPNNKSKGIPDSVNRNYWMRLNFQTNTKENQILNLKDISLEDLYFNNVGQDGEYWKKNIDELITVLVNWKWDFAVKPNGISISVNSFNGNWNYVNDENFTKSLLNIFLKINLDEDIKKGHVMYDNNLVYDDPNKLNSLLYFSNNLLILKCLSLYSEMKNYLNDFKNDQRNWRNGVWINPNIALDFLNEYISNFISFKFSSNSLINNYVFLNKLSNNEINTFFNLFKNKDYFIDVSTKLLDILNNNVNKTHFISNNISSINDIDFFKIYKIIISFFIDNKIKINFDVISSYSNYNNQITTSAPISLSSYVWDGTNFVNDWAFNLFNNSGDGSLKKIIIKSIDVEPIGFNNSFVNSYSRFNLETDNQLFLDNNCLLGEDNIYYNKTNTPTFLLAFNPIANNIININKVNVSKDDLLLASLNNNITLDIWSRTSNGEELKISNFDLINNDNSFKNYSGKNIFNEDGNPFVVSKEIANSLNKTIEFIMKDNQNIDGVFKPKNTFFDFEVKDINSIVFNPNGNGVKFLKDKNNENESNEWISDSMNIQSIKQSLDNLGIEYSETNYNSSWKKLIINYNPNYSFNDVSKNGGFFVIAKIKNWSQYKIVDGEWTKEGKEEFMNTLNNFNVNISEFKIENREISNYKYDSDGYFLIKVNSSMFNNFEASNSGTRIWDIVSKDNKNYVSTNSKNKLYFNTFRTIISDEFIKNNFGTDEKGNISFKSGFITKLWDFLYELISNDLTNSSNKYLTFNITKSFHTKDFLFEKWWNEYMPTGNVNWEQLYIDIREKFKSLGDNSPEYIEFKNKFEDGSNDITNKGCYNFFRFIKQEPLSFKKENTNLSDEEINDYYSLRNINLNNKIESFEFDINKYNQNSNEGDIKYNFNLNYKFTIESFKIQRTIDSINETTPNPYWNLLKDDTENGLLSEYIKRKSLNVNDLFYENNYNWLPTNKFFELFEIIQDDQYFYIKPKDKDYFEITMNFSQIRKLGIIKNSPNSLSKLNDLKNKYNNQVEYLKNKSTIEKIRISNLLLVTALPISIILIILLIFIFRKISKSKKEIINNKLDNNEDLI